MNNTLQSQNCCTSSAAGNGVKCALKRWSICVLTGAFMMLASNCKATDVETNANYLFGGTWYDIGTGGAHVYVNYATSTNPTTVSTLYARYDSPTMSANNAPSPFVALADSEYSASYKAYYGFDRSAAAVAFWNSTLTAYPHWLQTDNGNGNSSVVSRVYLYSCTGNGGRGGVYCYSQDGTTWTTQSVFTLPNTQHNVITNTSPVYARYHRVNFTNGWSGDYSVAYYEMEFTSAIDNDPLTSATAPSPNTVKASTEDTGTGALAWKAFDRDYTTYWDSNNTSTYPHSITYNFGSNQVINGLMMKPVLNYAWSNFVFSGSTDSNNFTTITTGGMNNVSTNQYFTGLNPYGIAYQYYKITGSNGYDANIVSFYEIQLKQYK